MTEGKKSDKEIEETEETLRKISKCFLFEVLIQPLSRDNRDIWAFFFFFSNMLQILAAVQHHHSCWSTGCQFPGQRHLPHFTSRELSQKPSGH